jgi:ABC-2 type transport system permease protein
MNEWSRGAALVARRALLEQVRSTTFKLVTAILALASAAIVLVPTLLDDDGPSTVRLVVVEGADADVVAVARSLVDLAGVELRTVERPDARAVRQAVRDGDADAGLADGTVLVGPDDPGVLPAIVSQAVVVVETERQLAAAGMSAEELAALRAIGPPPQEVVDPVDDTDRAGVGFVVGIVLYLALMFAGSVIATSVATEKTARISEVLLAVLRPGQVVVGTVFAVGLVTLLQLVVLAVPALVALLVHDEVALPSTAAGDLVLALAWFVVGFALYAFVFAAAAALVDKITEVNAVVAPVTLVLLAGYMIGVTQSTTDPGGAVSVVASMVPLSAPMVMPIRWASGTVPVWQLVLSFALTFGAALVVVRVSGVVYRRALAITGRRVRVREVLGLALRRA